MKGSAASKRCAAACASATVIPLTRILVLSLMSRPSSSLRTSLISESSWSVETYSCVLPVCEACLPVAGERAHGTAGRDDPDRMVLSVSHHDLVVDLHRHTPREIETHGINLPVCEALLPVACQLADLARLGHAT
jgi:hypothetical protein